MKVLERLKAKAFSALVPEHLRNPHVKVNSLVVPLNDVLKELEPLMTHLQPENRPKLAPSYISKRMEALGHLITYFEKTKEYFEVLDKILEGAEKCGS